jgi:flagellin
MNSLNTNIPVSIGLNNLRLNNISTSQAMERLSSGLRINKGADDPSGLAISQGMRARLGGLSMAIQNTQDTINMLRTAGSAVEEVTQMVNRIRDLCVRGANEATLTVDDRRRIQSEIDSLKGAINQVGTNTTFNTKHITSSSSQFHQIDPANITITPWAGGPPPPMPGTPEYDEMSDHVISVVQDSIYKVYGMLGLAPDPGTTLNVIFANIDGPGTILATGGGGVGAMQITLDVFDFLDPDGAGALTASVGSDPNTNAFTREMVIAHEMTHAVLVSKGIGGSAWGQEMMASYVSQEGDLRIDGNEGGVAVAVAGALTSAPVGSAEYAECYLAAQAITVLHGTSALHDIALQVQAGNDWDQAVLNVIGRSYNNTFAQFEAVTDAFSLKYMSDGLDNGVEKSGLGWTNNPANWGPHTQWNSQVGPDSKQILEVATFWLAVGAGDYLCYANVTSNQRAWDSIESCDRAQEMVSTYGSILGMQENRLQHIVDDLEAEYINLSASRSRINDADMAVEVSSLTKSLIMNQTTQSVVAHANSSTQVINDLIDMSLS